MIKRFIMGNAAFTVSAEGAVRMEYADGGVFTNEPTLFAVRESDAPECPVRARRQGRSLIIETARFTLTYTDTGSGFTRDNLTARLHFPDGSETDWCFGENSGRNLGGTPSTLDGCDGEKPVPDGVLSKDGYYVINDSRKPVLKDGWISPRPTQSRFDIYLLVYGKDLRAGLRSLAAISGKVPLPRKCVFGSWYSRWWDYSSDEYRSIVREYEEHGFPLDILVMDMYWHYDDWHLPEGHPRRATYGKGHAGGNLGWTGYSWNRDKLPDAEALLAELNEKGITVTLNDHPADGMRDHEDAYPEFARLMGLDAEKKENIPFDPGDKKYMEAFFKTALEPHEKEGVSFWWVDWQQNYLMDEVPGVSDQPVLPWLNYLYYQHSKKDGKRGMSFSRWGGLGDHKNPVFFSGDCASLWEALQYEIAITVTAGNSLCFWWSHDIGGFFGDRNDEMYVRWVQFGITSAACRLHSQWDDKLDRRPWTWEADTCERIRRLFDLRSRLIPYIYSSAYESCRDTVPLLRPMYLDNPEEPEAYRTRDQYMLGDSILAAPISVPGEGEDCVASRSVWLPEGEWADFFTGERIHGGKRITATCSLDSFPLYVRAGSPIPMQPYRGNMTSAHLTELIIKVYVCDGDCRGSFTLYEDDGISESTATGQYLETEITFEKSGAEVTFTLTPRGEGYEGLPPRRRVVLEMDGVKGARCDGIKTEHSARGIRAVIENVAPKEPAVIRFTLE